jgi:hypothetical protein
LRGVEGAELALEGGSGIGPPLMIPMKVTMLGCRHALRKHKNHINTVRVNKLVNGLHFERI